jgi:hypothetical protein
VFVPEEFAMTAGKSHGPAGLAEPEVRRTELSFCPGVRRGDIYERVTCVEKKRFSHPVR